MDKALVLRFVQDTQPEEWEKLVAHYTGFAEDTFFTQLEKALKDRGLLDVLRQGIKIVPGIKFSLCYFRPASGLEPKRVAEYEANILSVMKEVEYSEQARQSARCRAVRQRPAGRDDGGQEPPDRLDLPPCRAAVPDRPLAGRRAASDLQARRARPFRARRRQRVDDDAPCRTAGRGSCRSTGDAMAAPATRTSQGEFRVAYLYRSGEWGEAIFSRDVLLDVIGRFMHLEKRREAESDDLPALPAARRGAQDDRARAGESGRARTT